MGSAPRLGPGCTHVNSKPTISALLAEMGGGYAVALGIDLDSHRPEEIYKWFLAALLYGARISESLATRTWREFERIGVLTPQRILDTSWEGLVQILDNGGYTRYDFKTATKLLEVNRKLLADYGGDLNTMHAAASDFVDLQQRIMALGKGIGPTTTSIFLRELRGRWDKATPPLSPLAMAAAKANGFLSENVSSVEALEQLQRHWREAEMPDDRFSDFEAALARAELRRRRFSQVRLATAESDGSQR